MYNTVVIALLLAITFIYALFDTFNNRNIPNIVAYASVVLGAAVTLIFNRDVLAYSAAFAAVIAVPSYLLYRIGQLGAGDGFELVAISLMLPFQPQPFMGNYPQPNMPFALSVFIAAGIVTIIGVPLYYLAKNRLDKGISKAISGKIKPDATDMMKAVAMLAVYLLLFVFTQYFFGETFASALRIMFLGISSATLMMYNKRINYSMIRMIYPSQLEDGDIIAVNLMAERDISRFRKVSRRFGRLADIGLIKEIKHVRAKIPVYRNSVPLSLSLFFGVVISLAIGNVLLFLV